MVNGVAENEDYDEEPSVPTDLLEIHVACEDNNMTYDEFKEAFG